MIKINDIDRFFKMNPLPAPKLAIIFKIFDDFIKIFKYSGKIDASIVYYIFLEKFFKNKHKAFKLDKLELKSFLINEVIDSSIKILENYNLITITNNLVEINIDLLLKLCNKNKIILQEAC